MWLCDTLDQNDMFSLLCVSSKLYSTPALPTFPLIQSHSELLSPVAPSAFDTNLIPLFDLLNILLFCFYTPAVEAPDNLPFPDGKEVSPEIEVETLPGNCGPFKHIRNTSN